jgi:ketosteroid isomerase-like protein
MASGWDAVRRTWETIFRHTETIAFEVSDERIEVRGDLAWVVCVEKIRAGEGEGTVIATNVLRRENDGWRMVHHHASAAPQPRAPAPPPRPSSKPN